jgi:hypothetical protein
MNPDSGRIHAVAENVRAAFGEGSKKVGDVLLGRVNPRPEETVEQVLARARAAEAARVPDSEPPPGAVVPDGWPRFNVGDEVGPVKGWWMEVLDVDVEDQSILLRPKRRAGKKGRWGR